MLRINYRFLAVVLVCFVLSGAGIQALHHVQTRRSAHVHLEKARAALQEGNLPEALALFRRYLSLVPNDMDALAEFGVSLTERCTELIDLRRTRSLSAQEDEELRRAPGQAYGVLERVLRSQSDREDQVVLRRSLARAALFLRRFKDALEQLQSPAMAASKDWGVLEMRAICQDTTGQKIDAAKSYDEAIELAPDQVRLYWSQAVLLRSPDFPTRVYRDNDGKLRLLPLPAPKDLEGSQLDLGEAADAYIVRMVEKNPKLAAAYVHSARYWSRRADMVAAAARRAPLEEAKQWIDRATKDVDTALHLEPDNVDALFLGAELALRRGRPNDARGYAERAVKTAPRNYRCYLIRAEVERQGGAAEKAIEWFQAGRKECPDEPGLLWRMATFLLDLGKDKTAEAEKVIEALQDLPAHRWPVSDQADATIDYLQGRLDLLQGKPSDAASKLERASPGLIANDTLFRSAQLWLGSSYRQLAAESAQSDEQKQQLVENQLAAYRRARGSDGTGIQARFAAAQTLALTDRLGEAIEEQRIAMGLPGAPALGWLQLATWLLQRYQSLQPSAREWEEVEKALGAAQAARDDLPDLPLRYAEMWAVRGNAAEAEKVLRKAIDQQRKSPAKDAALRRVNLWIFLAGVAQQEQAALPPAPQDWSRVDTILSEAEKDAGDSARLWVARARYVLSRYGNQAAPELLKLAKRVEGFPAPEQAPLLVSLAETLLQLGEVNEAKRFCRSAAEKQPDNLQVRLQVRLLQFEIAAREKDHATMKSLVTEIKNLDAQGDRWRAAEAVGLRIDAQHQLDEKKDQQAKQSLEKALALLADARKLNPKWPRVPLLMAEISDQLGQSSAALQYYREAIEGGERSVAAVQRAVQLVYALRGSDAAEQAATLIQHWASQPDLAASQLSAVLQAAPDLALRPETLPQSLEAARKAAAISKNYRDHLWLGQVLIAAAEQDAAAARLDPAKIKLDEAEKALRHANQLSPNEAATWIVLLDLLARTNRADEARKMIPQVQKSVPAEQLPWVLPRCHEVAHEPAEAAKLYEAGLSKTPGDLELMRQAVEFYRRYNRPREARVHLEEMIQRSGENKVALVWARRQLALLLFSSVKDQERQRAQKLIAANLEVDPKSVDDRRAKAVVLASDPDRASRQEAVAILEDLRKENLVTADDSFLLAHLLWSDKDPAKPGARDKDTAQAAREEELTKWRRAKELMNSLLASRRVEPRHVAAYASALLDHGETTDARLWIAQLEKLAPNQPPTRQLRAELLFATRNYDALARELKSVPAASPAFPDQAASLLSAAVWLRGFAGRLRTSGSPADADKLDREAQSCLDKALDLAEKAGPQSDGNALAHFATRLLGTQAAKAAQLQRLGAVLDAAIQKQNRPVPLLLVLADLRTAEGRFDEVEALYEENLRRDGNNFVALNNLAVLLALRGKRLDEAAKMMEKAVQLVGPNPTLLDSRAMVAAARGRSADALKDLNQAIDEEPRFAPYFHRALIHLENGQRAAAQEDWNKARQLGLSEQVLHPLERKGYERLKEGLKQG